MRRRLARPEARTGVLVEPAQRLLGCLGTRDRLIKMRMHRNTDHEVRKSAKTTPTGRERSTNRSQ
jgi:hypothetical protein